MKRDDNLKTKEEKVEVEGVVVEALPNTMFTVRLENMGIHCFEAELTAGLVQVWSLKALEVSLPFDDLKAFPQHRYACADLDMATQFNKGW